jgi:AcrR family transcriptional regulator
MAVTAAAQVPRINPRVRRTKDHVLQTARRLLPELGPIAMTFTALSGASGVTRQTLYRHWPSREALLAELVLTGPDVAYPEPGTDPRRIATEFLHSLSAGMSDAPTASALMSLAAHAPRDPASAAALAAISAGRCDALNALLRPSGRHVGQAEFACLCGPVIYQRLIARADITDGMIYDIVSRWLDRNASAVSPS